MEKTGETSGWVGEKALNLLENAGLKPLTKEELAWISPPKTFGSEVPRNTIEVNTVRGVYQNHGAYLAADHLDHSTWGAITTAAVFSDKGDPADAHQMHMDDEQRAQDFLTFLSTSDKAVDVAGQLDKLLELTNGSIYDAAYLGMMALRITARNLDKKACPNIEMTKDLRDKIEKNLLPFDPKNKPQDALGDAYYFWTKVYTRLSVIGPSVALYPYKILDQASATTMSFIRKNLAHQAVISDHTKASKLGTKMANILYELSK